ncbi:MAG: flagellar FlbD family protein [Ignavibacteriales bacterium]|nr:flagellar FlbD family protein [Ignavibacteriales bacterium]
MGTVEPQAPSAAMIEVTRLQNIKLVLNADLIESIETTPDTVISLTSGKRIMVKETVEEVIQKIVEYKMQCNTLPTPKNQAHPPRG